MRHRSTVILAIALCVAPLLLWRDAHAQYVYLDLNGDGVNDFRDGLVPSGEQWVDLWLVTDRNRDGSPAMCGASGAAMPFDEYSVAIQPSGPGSATIWAYFDYTGFPEDRNTTQFNSQIHIGKRGAAMLPAGRYKLGRIGLTVQGTPMLTIIPKITDWNVDSYLTAFHSQCAGIDGDYYIKLGTDFTDTNGLPGIEHPPALTAPQNVSAIEGDYVSVQASATDPDAGQTVTITSTVTPPAPFLSPQDVGSGPSPVTATIVGTPGYADAGTYSVQWRAFDSYSALSPDSATTIVSIGNTDRPPAVTAPEFETVGEGELLQFAVSATDPDGEPIQSLTATGMPPNAFFSYTANLPTVIGTFSWVPSFTQAGDYSVSFVGQNGLSGSAATALTVININDPPVLAVPHQISVDQGQRVSFAVEVSDPDGEAISALTVIGLPIGATFDVNEVKSHGDFEWTPSFRQSGVFPVVFTASNALTSQDTTTVTVAPVGLPRVGELRLKGPNPFAQETTLECVLGQSSHASLLVFDTAGHHVRRILDEELPQGIRSAVWDGRDDAGRFAKSGVYYVMLEVRGVKRAAKVVLMR